ncbi:Hydroxyneurosporene synthase (CrtC) [Bifidobacterium margollesii]|uniref:Hydroxyneurosporene synthase (CrtC) n=1 Tax=Bifidobacterium margollesii TaxID=2020964 RepID=A0A2N5J8U2_9BIFI|nr:hypothetical protein [Bifidobacterium margollesii]PLS30629.1 Hydroxyneurosporene synthase (CrtC) [Bifidobacterium margollesii]
MSKAMNPIRLENTPSDFAKRGVRQGPVEVWEDGRRDDDRAGAYEWWYFDFMMDDGTKVVIHFHTKPVRKCGKKGYTPSPGMAVYLPDGTKYEDEPLYKADEIAMATDRCDVRMGPHTVQGDLSTYEIHYEPVNGIGADLTLTSMSSPWRPGNAYFDFGDGRYFTWLCVVPKGRVTGTIQYEGKTHRVNGYGYHDHQWCTVDHVTAFNHWFWGRQAFGDYTMLNFQIVTSKHYDYQKIAMTVLEDKDGNVVFENTDPANVTWKVTEEYTQPETDTRYPKRSLFIIDSEQGHMTYDVDVLHEIGYIDAAAMLPKPMVWALERKGFHPTYVREAAHGVMDFTPRTTKANDIETKESIDSETLHRESDMIYEFIYPGITYLEHI